MGKPLLPPAAAPSSPKLEVAFMAFLLASLMVSQYYFPSAIWFLCVAIAIVLSFMIEEDARNQTVDLYLLSFLGVFMLLISMLTGQTQRFILHTVITTCFFRFLLVITSLWLSCRAASGAVPSEAWQEDAPFSDDRLIGYLPIFAIVYILYLGFGESLIPIVFYESYFAVDILRELILFYPSLFYVFLLIWFLSEGILLWLEHSKHYPILWAFGGGDVLFLGLFGGHLGVATLFALYFLSLIVRVFLSLIQFFLDSMVSSI